MDAVFIRLLNMSISASWLVLVVLALRLVLKKAPRWIHVALWAMVALRLVCPISFESVLSLIPSGETIPEAIVYAKNPAIDSGVTVIDQAVNTSLVQYRSPQIGNSVNPVQIDLFIGENIWCLGMVVMVGWASVSYFRLKRKVAASLDLGNGVYLCDYVDTPFILGIIKPKIYLPSSMEPDSASHVLAHERAHIARKDHWWKPFGYLLLTVYWFNPLLWLAYILLCRDIEQACDEKVIRNMGIPQKKAYSEALLNCSVKRRHIAACPLAFGEVGVKERVKSVLNYKKPAFWIVLAAILALIVTAVCFLTDPVTEKSLFGKTYRVEKVVYRNPALSYYMTEENAPQFHISDDRTLYRKAVGEDWEIFGFLSQIQFRELNFGELFLDEQALVNDVTLSQLQEQNREAWLLSGPSKDNPESTTFYLLLRQKNGENYIAEGLVLTNVYPLHENVLDATLSVTWLYRLTETSQEEEFIDTYALNEIYWAPYLGVPCTVTIPHRNQQHSGTAQVIFDGEKYLITDDAGSRSYAYCVKSFAEAPQGTCTEYFFLTDDPDMTVEKYLEAVDILPTEVLYIDIRIFDAAKEYGDVPEEMKTLFEFGSGGYYCHNSVFYMRDLLQMGSARYAYLVERVDYHGNLLCKAEVKGIPNAFLELEDGGFVVFSWAVSEEKDRVSCFDAAGNLRWGNPLGDGSSSHVWAMYQRNGDIYCFGEARTEENLDDVFVWRFSPDGELKQMVNFGGSDFDSVHRVLETEKGFVLYGRTQSGDGDLPFSEDGYGVPFRAEVSDELVLLHGEKFENQYSRLLGYHDGKPVFADDPILKVSQRDNFPENVTIGSIGIFDSDNGYVIVRSIRYDTYPYANPLVSMLSYYGQTVITGYDSRGNPQWQLVGNVHAG